MAKIIIIGGGAAGMMAAGMCAKRGFETHLFEKNDRLGKKLYITGKGRCNITNHTDVEGILENIPGNPYFLYSAFYTLDSYQVQTFFNDLGVATKIERGNRVFPVSDKAGDVVRALEDFVKKNRVKIHCQQSVEKILTDKNKVTGIRLQNGKIEQADGVILCTGGLSYPGTGSTGDGYKMAKELGHHITKLYPSLVPLKVKEKWCTELMGLSLKNTAITVKDNKNKTIYKDFGEMLFTHYGVSGPMIISASRHMVADMADSYTISIDLKPALDEKALDLRILRDFEKYVNKDFKNALEELLPQKMIPVVIQLSGISPMKKVHDITKAERKSFVQLLKNLTVSICGNVGYQEAIITCGGIEVDEINPSTMESKIVKNLYFAGELIDVDGYTGGFNLQIAFSTGYLAGNSIL